MADRDFSTISPSARSILLMKGHTSLPWAREAAEAISLPDPFVPDENNPDFSFWAKVMHFESRYLGINRLLAGVGARNILELSAGYSFRCLEWARDPQVFYLDTDLPEVIREKQRLLTALSPDPLPGRVQLLPLNALDGPQFARTVAAFPPGPVAVVNEGLLIYFSTEEKVRLCASIRQTLERRGGRWITSDIYLRAGGLAARPAESVAGKAFSEAHRIEENKFASFDEARAFLGAQGFVVDAEADVESSQLSSFERFVQNTGFVSPGKTSPSQRLQTCWRLKLAD